jgi:hypothetical protein
MRTDQPMGLPDEATAFLQENVLMKGANPCRHCQKPTIDVFDCEQYGSYTGMFEGQDYPLLRYKLKGGGVAEEFLQASPWSSGPVLFLGLKIKDAQGSLVREILWTDNEIRANT